MAHEISFSIILRLSDDPVKACEEHERFATALRGFIAALDMKQARTDLSMREVRAPQQRGPRKPRIAAVPQTGGEAA
jgi:hypothetical protein